MSTSLVILGCSQRKRQTSRILPAIDRYNGPVFGVLRKHTRETPDNPAAVCVLSARFGLIRGERKIPRYNLQLSGRGVVDLRQRVKKQLERTLKTIKPKRLFVSVGAQYWPLLSEGLQHKLNTRNVVVATGGIGGRASQLSRWLGSKRNSNRTLPKQTGTATLLGTTVCLSRAGVVQEARRELANDSAGAQRFETWYVPIGIHRVAPKWLVAKLFDKSVSRFRTADARRVLALLGVSCLYASHD